MEWVWRGLGATQRGQTLGAEEAHCRAHTVHCLHCGFCTVDCRLWTVLCAVCAIADFALQTVCRSCCGGKLLTLIGCNKDAEWEEFGPACSRFSGPQISCSSPASLERLRASEVR